KRTYRPPPEKWNRVRRTAGYTCSIPHASEPRRLLRLDVGEALDAPQLGEEPGPQPDDRERGNAAGEHGGNRTEPRGRGAGAEVAELVRRPDEERVHRAHASAHLVGRAELHHARAHEHAH